MHRCNEFYLVIVCNAFVTIPTDKFAEFKLLQSFININYVLFHYEETCGRKNKRNVKIDSNATESVIWLLISLFDTVWRVLLLAGRFPRNPNNFPMRKFTSNCRVPHTKHSGTIACLRPDPVRTIFWPHANVTRSQITRKQLLEAKTSERATAQNPISSTDRQIRHALRSRWYRFPENITDYCCHL